jgi:hypothetical protein
MCLCVRECVRPRITVQAQNELILVLTDLVAN